MADVYIGGDTAFDAKYERKEHHPWNEPPKDVPRRFFKICGSLYKFRVFGVRGFPKFTCTRDDDGDVVSLDKIANDDDKVDKNSLDRSFREWD
jgi:hypothetical protein